MTGSSQPFDAFISYSHRSDLELAGDLQHDIETLIRTWYRSRGLRIFRDSISLAANPDLWSNIQNALLRSAFLILLASPESAASTWVPLEIELFVAARGRARTCIVLTRGGLPWLPDPDTQKLGDPTCSIAPAVFASLCSPGVTPLIVDLRPFRAMAAATRRKSTAYMQCVAAIVAAIKQTDKDAVYGEHLRRGRRLLQIVTSTAVVFAILAAFAVRQTITEQASRQRAEDAGEQARAAQRETAEGVLDLRGRAAVALLARPETAYEALAEGVLATAPDLAAGRRPRAVRLAGLGQAVSLLSDLRLLRIELPWTHGMEHEHVFINRDGTEAVGIADDDLPVLRWRLRDGHERSVEVTGRCGPEKPLGGARLSPDGRWVAYGCGSSQIEVADTETTSVRWNRNFGESIAAQFHYSSDGGLLNFSTGADESSRHRRLRVSDGSELPRTPRIPGWVLAIPPGGRAAVLPRAEVITNEIALSIAGVDGTPEDAEFSPDGRWFAAVINDVFVMKGPDLEQRLLPGPNQFSFSIDSKYLAPNQALSGAIGLAGE